MTQLACSPKALHRVQQGFTMIELMLVMGMIGILAAIAMPAYQDYTYRARLAEVIQMAEAMQKELVQYHDRWGTWPANNQEAGLPAPEQIQGEHFSHVHVVEGALVVTVKPKTVSRSNAAAHQDSTTPPNAKLVMRPWATEPGMAVRWVCQNAVWPEAEKSLMPMPVDAAQLVEDRFLPAPCRTRK